MSWEVWGDGDDEHMDSAVERLLDAGWWSVEQVDEAKTAVKDLLSERVYEDGDKANGISTRFLMRITKLASIVQLDVPAALLSEAKIALAQPTPSNETRHGGV